MPIFNVCGTNYQYPNVGEKPWGTIHIAWASAVSSCVTALNTQVSQIAANQFISPMLADGDIIIQDVGIPTRLPIGAVGQVLTVGVSNLPEWGAVVGTGDVVGPAGAVDENIAVYDGVTGKLLKDGGITVAAILAQISAVPNITKWGSTAWTPTGSWVANTTYTGVYRRVNDTLEARVSLDLTGAPTATSLNINLPAGLTIDTSKLLGTLTQNVLGHGTSRDDSSTGEPVLVVRYNGATSVRVYYDLIGSVWLDDSDRVDGSVPVPWANNDTLNIYFSVPILEWA